MQRNRERVGAAARKLGAATAVAGALLLTVPGWSQAPGEPGRYPYGPGMMWGGGWYGMLFGPLFMILWLVGLIAAVGLLSRWFAPPWHGSSPPHDAPPGRTPIDILKERYARGEIDKEEFDERRAVLGE